MARKIEGASTALAKEEPAGALAFVDPLAGILAEGDVLDVTGAEELGAGDVRIPVLVFNTKFTPAGQNDPIPPTRFLQTITEDVREKVTLQIVYDHKSRTWSTFDEKLGKRVVHCRSWDVVTGRMEDGHERPCKGCPDYEWTRDEASGKNVRNCGDVHNLVAIDRETQDVVMMPLRKTAISPFREYFQRHFYRKRPIAGSPPRKVDLPLFARETIATLRMERDGGMAWAMPVFEPGPMLSRDEILFGADTCRDFIAVRLRQLETAAEAADALEAPAGKGDASFDFGANEKPVEPVGTGASRF